MALTAEDLLMGSSLVHEVEIPPSILDPKGKGKKKKDTIIKLRPLSIQTVNLIAKAAKNDSTLIPLLMLKESIVEPKMELDQIQKMHSGLAQFLIGKVNEISGMVVSKNF